MKIRRVVVVALVVMMGVACSEILGLEDPGYPSASAEAGPVGSDAGDSGQSDVVAPVIESGPGRARMVDVGMGAFHACARGEDGSVWCWGDNGAGQLGSEPLTVTRVRAERVAGLPSVSQLSVGMTHTCAVAEDQSVWCWGSNAKGALGFDPADDATCKCAATPRAVPNLKARRVLALWDTTCAITDNGVACWGANDSGLLGTSKTAGESSFTPVAIPELGGTTAAIGGDPWPCKTVCALTSEREVVCWGSNMFAGLGHDPLTGGDMGSAASPYNPIPRPVLLPDASKLRQIGEVNGNYASCGVRLDGTLFCWGADNCGQLGPVADAGTTDGGSSRRSAAVAVLGLASVKSVRSGDATCALLANQSVACWGDDTSGLVGAPSATTCASFDALPGGVGTHQPQVKNGLFAISVSVGFRAAAAVDTNGNVVAWGKNEHAQLGHTIGASGDDASAQDRNPVPQFVDGLGP